MPADPVQRPAEYNAFELRLPMIHTSVVNVFVQKGRTEAIYFERNFGAKMVNRLLTSLWLLFRHDRKEHFPFLLQRSVPLW
jgi:hypothetical protein